MKSLRLLVGTNARNKIEKNGLTPDIVRLIVGASGGAKWLVLRGLDQFVFGKWMLQANTETQLLGSSIGAWRMACAAQNDPAAAFNRFHQAYFDYSYEKGQSQGKTTRDSYDTLAQFLPADLCAEAVSNPLRQLNIMAVRCKGLTASDNKLPQALGLIAAAGGNAVSRAVLGKFYDRALFKSQAGGLDSGHFKGFSLVEGQLSANNLHDALMASGSIPFVTDAIANIEGIEAGVYRDGGIIDYHWDIDWDVEEGIVLYPHFYPHVIPGWFDKSIKRKAISTFNNVLLLAPSDEFVASLPGGKIPDRRNFLHMDDEDRLKYWNYTCQESYRLADELDGMLNDHGKLMDALENII